MLFWESAVIPFGINIYKNEAKMKYAMESEGEAKRLETQAQQKGYQLEGELAGIDLPVSGKFLDAGCGSGLLCRYLKTQASSREVWGVDFSDLRLHQAAQAAAAENLNIAFQREDLTRLSFEDASFDVVFCRYVFEHLARPDVVLKELHRILRPNGKIVLINFDGIVVNMHSRDQFLQEQLEQLAKGYVGDLYIARKLPALLAHHKFGDIHWLTSCMDFTASNRQEEALNTRSRFEFANEVLCRIFGGEKQANEFKTRYFSALDDPSTTIFYTKFVVEGTKR
jgi:2-polyprenyl-3-methyl-5-hydroxy-6-metoxy-1,4-benzoquinol methylase